MLFPLASNSFLMARMPLIVIAGPTSVGKTAISIALAKKLNAEIVSADSRQIYKEMNIGTAKPTLEEQQGILHYLLDIIFPDEMFTLADYVKKAWDAIEAIHAKGKTPIMTGSSGLYIRAVAEGFVLPNAPPNPELRQKLQERLDLEGTKPLYDELCKIDPQGALHLDPNNPRRLIRFYEIYHQTQTPPSAFWSMRDSRAESLFVLKFFLTRERQKVYERIKVRVDEMEKKGLLEEVKSLLKKYPKNLKAFQTHGYQEVFPYLEGRISWEESKELIVRHTCQYAHRQWIWFRKEKGVQWEEAEPFGEWEVVAERLFAIIQKRLGGKTWEKRR